MMRQKLIQYTFCITQFSYIRSRQEPKIVFKPQYLFLSKQSTPAKRLAGSLTFRGKFRYIYFRLQKSYILFLRWVLLKQYTLSSLFFFLLLNNNLFFNLDYALWDWCKTLTSIFRMEKTRVYDNYKLWIRYVKPKRRYLLIWRWLSLLSKCFKLHYKTYLLSFFSLYKELFLKPVSSNKLSKLKLQVYKIYLYKLY